MKFVENFNWDELVNAFEHLLDFIPYGNEIILSFMGIAIVKWALVPLIRSLK